MMTKKRMETVTIPQIDEQLRQLPPEKLAVVYDFVLYVAERQFEADIRNLAVASEEVLGQDWNRPEENKAWASL